jgi:hypothetical protein
MVTSAETPTEMAVGERDKTAATGPSVYDCRYAA